MPATSIINETGRRGEKFEQQYKINERHSKKDPMRILKNSPSGDIPSKKETLKLMRTMGELLETLLSRMIR